MLLLIADDRWWPIFGQMNKHGLSPCEESFITMQTNISTPTFPAHAFVSISLFHLCISLIWFNFPAVIDLVYGLKYRIQVNSHEVWRNLGSCPFKGQEHPSVSHRFIGDARPRAALCALTDCQIHFFWLSTYRMIHLAEKPSKTTFLIYWGNKIGLHHLSTRLTEFTEHFLLPKNTLTLLWTVGRWIFNRLVKFRFVLCLSVHYTCYMLSCAILIFT